MQYASFRDNIPYMAVVVVLHPLLRQLYHAVFGPAQSESKSSNHVQGQYRLRTRISYDVAFAAIFLFVLHGFSALKIGLILYMNFLLAKRLPASMVPFATWGFNLVILFANELCHGYPYTQIAETLLPAPSAQGQNAWASWLDSFGGLIPRWEVLFKMTILRLISFNMDYYWSLAQDKASSLEVCTRTPWITIH